MEVVVYLALFVLASVFCFSLFILIVMCRRRALAVKRFHAAASLHFTKSANENVESVVQLGPLIAQVLDSNQWIYDVPGILQHCVVILKLCHSLTEKLSTIQLTSITPKLNDQLLVATARILPRFDDLMRTMADDHVDVRLLEARASSLVSACWALTFPFSVISPKQVERLDSLLNEMANHVEALRLIVRHLEQNFVSEKDKVAKGKPPPSILTTVVEETPLMESSATDRNDSSTESQQSEEAPADPGAPAVS